MFLNYEKGAGLLRYERMPGEPVDAFVLEMLQQNTPEGVLLLGRETNEEGDCLLLPVAGLEPLDSGFQVVINKFTINEFLIKINAIRNSLRDYMIPEEELVLRPEWTWVRPETGEPVLLVLPTPAARDLSLPMEDYETLLRARYERCRCIAEETAEEEKSAKRSAKRSAPGKPWRRVLQEFWENLD